MFPSLTLWVIGYFICINLITLIVFAMDKISSQSNAWRTRENTLLGLALMGGSIGALLAMHFFRHKTKKGSFLMLLAVILLLQLAIVYFMLQHTSSTPAPTEIF